LHRWIFSIGFFRLLYCWCNIRRSTGIYDCKYVQ